MSRPWFRMYHEWVNDPKVQLLAFEDQRHYIALLCLKCNDTLDSAAPNETYRDRMVARALGLAPDAAIEARRRLVEVGLITDTWHPTKWNSRQFESDTSADRTRAWRMKRHGGKPVTSQDRHGDCLDQIRTDQNRTDKKPPAAPVDGLDAVAWDVWFTYRREIRKPLKPASIPAAQRKLAAFGKDQSAVVDQSVAQGWTGLFPLGREARQQERKAVC